MATTIQSASDRTAAVRSTITALHGAGAGMMEALICHPLDGSLRSSIQSIHYQSPLTFYRGLGAVLFGIMPKMAVRFTSFETGLAAAVTEAVLVVTPTEVVKIRLQTAGTHAQGLSSSRFGYRSAPEAMMAIIRTEGVQALWCGVRLTAAQQRTNQAETRIQKEPSRGSEAGSARLIPTVRLIVEQEGFAALYRGTLPRVLQVGIGQAVTFSTYEVLRGLL
ncbi:mitochondrial carrier domain-containing protein [Aspergillus alliaceus]|uniref:Mitochondrial carrier domain-containing protein n=1 Tax=Petromyces alliaceus TaxID=209559 RepID=A0A5N7C290_PETAA|nr:mitochondrial carrier domain-containing protein [Aspergillus alliaceus]